MIHCNKNQNYMIEASKARPKQTRCERFNIERDDCNKSDMVCAILESEKKKLK